MTPIFEITQAERNCWQRQAAAELTRILQAHRDLPPIAWTVGPAGSVLIGQISGLAPAAQVREVFGGWRSALALEEYREHQMSAGAVWLHAATRRNRVKIRLSATVFGESEDA